MQAVIISNGSIDDYTYYTPYFDNADLVVCADGGAAHVRGLGVIPHLLVGDLDSIQEEDLAYIKSLGTRIEKFPVEKDMTDTELAVEYAIEHGCTEICFVGGLGSRFDHSLANILQLKPLLDRGVQGVVVNESNEITLVRDRIVFTCRQGWKVSLLPLSDKAEGVTTQGLYYPLQNATLHMGSSRGVSNEFVQERAEVTLTKGLLIAILARD